MRTTTRFVGLLTAAAVIAAASQINWSDFDEDHRKVTFTVTVDDGKVWAGPFKATYSIGDKPTTVAVSALKESNVRPNQWSLTKTVKRGTAVSLTARADWPGKPITVQLRGLTVNPRPVTATSPLEPAVFGTVK